MTKINWKVRVKNVYFWISLISAMFVLISEILPLFNVIVDLTEIEARILDCVRSLFTVLAIVGVVNDPTTSGLNDSNLAMTYEVPKVDVEEETFNEE